MGENMDFDQAISFGALVVSLVLALGTLVLALETKRMREAQTEPDVYVSFQPQAEDYHLLDLIIGNAGQGTAYDVKFKINLDIEYHKGRYLSKLSFFEDGISYLAPNQILKSNLTNTSFGYFKNLSIPFEIQVKYRNKTHKKFKKVYPINLSSLEELSYQKIPSIPNNIDTIQKDIEKISNSLEKLSKK